MRANNRESQREADANGYRTLCLSNHGLLDGRDGEPRVNWPPNMTSNRVIAAIVLLAANLGIAPALAQDLRPITAVDDRVEARACDKRRDARKNSLLAWMRTGAVSFGCHPLHPLTNTVQAL